MKWGANPVPPNFLSFRLGCLWGGGEWLWTTHLLHSIYLKEFLFLRMEISNVLKGTEDSMTPSTSH